MPVSAPLDHEIPEANTHPRLVLKPTRGWAAFDFRDLWRHQDLLWILAAREIKLRYKQTALGVFWVILQPLAAALIFAAIFGHFARLPSDGAPYLLFVFCGLLGWNFFASALQRASNSLVMNAQLISKVYFPRIIIPLAHIVAVLIDFAVTLAVVLIIAAFHRIVPTWRIVGVPLFLAFIILSAVGMSLWFSALSVRYRDFMYALPFLVQVWMYATPIVYATSLIPERWRFIYSVNPLVGPIEGLRWALLGGSSLTASMVVVAGIISLLLFVTGTLFFWRVERHFADLI